MSNTMEISLSNFFHVQHDGNQPLEFFSCPTRWKSASRIFFKSNKVEISLSWRQRLQKIKLKMRIFFMSNTMEISLSWSQRKIEKFSSPTQWKIRIFFKSNKVEISLSWRQRLQKIKLKMRIFFMSNTMEISLSNFFHVQHDGNQPLEFFSSPTRWK